MHGVPAMTETERWELADVNGDGAADLVRIGDELRVWINQLDGSFADAGGAEWPALAADEVVIVTDIDGSGTMDVLRVDTDGSGPWRVWTLFAERPGLLARFENGLGYVREHTYRSAAELAAEDAAAGTPWATTPPEPMPVLTETREDDGSGWTSILRRGLRDGWYDPTRGEFRGFAELTDSTTGDPYTESATITRRYDLGQTEEARGLQLVAAETRSPRGILVREEHTLAVDSPAPGVHATRRTATDTYHLEAGPASAAARVRIEWDHDEWGNVIEERAFGRVDLETGVDIPGDERITTTTYATPEAAGRAAYPRRRADRLGRGRRADHRDAHLLRRRTRTGPPARPARCPRCGRSRRDMDRGRHLDPVAPADSRRPRQHHPRTRCGGRHARAALGHRGPLPGGGAPPPRRRRCARHDGAVGRGQRPPDRGHGPERRHDPRGLRRSRPPGRRDPAGRLRRAADDSPHLPPGRRRRATIRDHGAAPHQR
jgi:hypothetical protein